MSNATLTYFVNQVMRDTATPFGHIPWIRGHFAAPASGFGRCNRDHISHEIYNHHPTESTGQLLKRGPPHSGCAGWFCSTCSVLQRGRGETSTGPVGWGR